MCELAPRRPSARLPLRGPLARTHSARARVAAAACDNQVSAAPSLRAQDQAIDEVVPDADGAGGGGGLMGLLQGFGHVDFFGLGADQGKGGKAGLESVAEADAAPADNASAVGRGGGGGGWGLLASERTGEGEASQAPGMSEVPLRGRMIRSPFCLSLCWCWLFSPLRAPQWGARNARRGLRSQTPVKPTFRV